MPERELLLALIDEAFDKKSWHGPNLKGALRGVTAAQALWRPAPERHNIWELTLHAAYWKYVVRRKLNGEKRGSFAQSGSNWFECPHIPDDRLWKQHRALLDSEHRQLRESVARASLSNAAILRLSRGAASHDLYHAGQIQLLKRLCHDSEGRKHS